MKTSRKFLLVSFSAMVLGTLPTKTFASNEIHPEVAKGNKALKEKQPEKAIEHYKKAQEEIGKISDLSFNLGGAHYAQENYEEAARAFLDATQRSEPKQRAEAFRHYGDSIFRQNNLEGAIQAYEQALSLDPEDAIAQKNLEVALKQQQQQEQQEPQNDSPENEEDKEDQEEQEDQKNEQQNPENQSSENQEEQSQNNEENSEEQENNEENSSPESKDEENSEEQKPQNSNGDQEKEENSSPKEKKGSQGQSAEEKKSEEETPSQKLLDALRAQEKNFLHEHRKRQAGQKQPVDKDW